MTTLARTIESILSQTYDDIEYVVKDGGSTDATVDIIKRYEPLFHGHMRWVSARDGGIYEAMNEGILMATGDVVGILNSDDYFTSDDVLETVASHMRDTALDAVYGDIHFVRPKQSQQGGALLFFQAFPSFLASLWLYAGPSVLLCP